MGHNEYIFIDESGDLGPQGSKCFTIVALTTRQTDALGRIMKRLRERKLKKKMQGLSEIKASNSNDSIRRYVLEKVASLNCDIAAVVISKTEVERSFFKNKHESYNQLCSILFETIGPDVGRVEITIDKRHRNRILQQEFDNYLTEKIGRQRPEIGITIRHLDSHSSSELQVVDFIAWAVNRKVSCNDSTHFDLIKVRVKRAEERLEELGKM